VCVDVVAFVAAVGVCTVIQAKKHYALGTASCTLVCWRCNEINTRTGTLGTVVMAIRGDAMLEFACRVTLEAVLFEETIINSGE
jgi:hypothetical protein